MQPRSAKKHPPATQIRREMGKGLPGWPRRGSFRGRLGRFSRFVLRFGQYRLRDEWKGASASARRRLATRNGSFAFEKANDVPALSFGDATTTPATHGTRRRDREARASRATTGETAPNFRLPKSSPGGTSGNDARARKIWRDARCGDRRNRIRQGQPHDTSRDTRRTRRTRKGR